MLKKYIFHSWKPWAKILFLWAIHGDETCWYYAITKLIDKINSKELTPLKWEIQAVPLCNPQWFEQNKRYLNVNLNRVIKKTPHPELYEEFLANEICSFIQEADIIIDIHSFSSEGPPFIFEDVPDMHEVALAAGIGDIITGRPQMYSACDSSDSIGYAYTMGKKWILLECWINGSQESIDLAYKWIVNILRHYEMIEVQNSIENKQYQHIRAHQIFFKSKEWSLIKARKHLDPVKKWEIIATYTDWETLSFENDWYILLPFVWAQIWDERFYFGKEEVKN